MKEQQVKDVLWAAFLKWMEHQTVMLDPTTGETIYYDWDVKRFLRSVSNEEVVD